MVDVKCIVFCTCVWSLMQMKKRADDSHLIKSAHKPSLSSLMVNLNAEQLINYLFHIHLDAAVQRPCLFTHNRLIQVVISDMHEQYDMYMLVKWTGWILSPKHEIKFCKQKEEYPNIQHENIWKRFLIIKLMMLDNINLNEKGYMLQEWIFR